MKGKLIIAVILLFQSFLTIGQNRCGGDNNASLSLTGYMIEDTIHIIIKNTDSIVHMIPWSNALPYSDIFEELEFNVYSVKDSTTFLLKRIENIPLYDMEVNYEFIEPGSFKIKSIPLSDFLQTNTILDTDYFFCSYAFLESNDCRFKYYSNKIHWEEK
jgi:hypothetical protein